MQAAIGRVALRDLLREHVRKRRIHASYLNRRLSKIEAIRLPKINDDFEDVTEREERNSMYLHSYYKYYCFVIPEKLRPGWDRNRIMAAISAEGVPCYTGAGELYLEGVFNGWDSKIAGDQSCLVSSLISASAPVYLPVARELAETALMFLVHPTLSIDDEIEDTCKAVEKVMRCASL